MTFTEYLQGVGLRAASISTYNRCLGNYLLWLGGEGLSAGEVSYNDLLLYLSRCRGKGFNNRYINQHLGVIRYYYKYLQQGGYTGINPAVGLVIKGERHTLPRELLGSEELDGLYESYTPVGYTGARDKAMLGLLVYQGLNTRELEALQKENINHAKGKVTVPSTGRGNGRELRLEPFQVMELYSYSHTTRDKLIEQRGKGSDRLFLSSGGSESLHYSLQKLTAELQRQSKEFRSLRQLRESRISLWVSAYGLRRAQYMAGHRYVSSTERYSISGLEDLRDELAKVHPLSGG